MQGSQTLSPGYCNSLPLVDTVKAATEGAAPKYVSYDSYMDIVYSRLPSSYGSQGDICLCRTDIDVLVYLAGMFIIS